MKYVVLLYDITQVFILMCMDLFSRENRGVSIQVVDAHLSHSKKKSLVGKHLQIRISPLMRIQIEFA